MRSIIKYIFYFNCTNFVKFTTNPNASNVPSSIEPTELYTNVDPNKTANANILVS